MSFTFAAPKPTINFTETEAYTTIKRFIFEIDNFIKSNPTSKATVSSIMDEIDKIVTETPLSSSIGRYANLAMVQVIEKIEEITGNPYLQNAFGNKIRMDFGTGHELNFLCYLYTCNRDCKDFDLSVIKAHLIRYFGIIRKYIKKFNVEAAGSGGYWSVDDYLLLPYVFGSSENFHCGDYLHIVEDGIFREAQITNNSIMLRNICKMPWKSINLKFLEIYDKEVLSKKVVTQHFIYSEYLKSDPELLSSDKIL